jgi:hypothetical protein
MILDDLVFDSATSSSVDDIIEKVVNEGLQRNTND